MSWKLRIQQTTNPESLRLTCRPQNWSSEQKPGIFTEMQQIWPLSLSFTFVFKLGPLLSKAGRDTTSIHKASFSQESISKPSVSQVSMSIGQLAIEIRHFVNQWPTKPQTSREPKIKNRLQLKISFRIIISFVHSLANNDLWRVGCLKQCNWALLTVL